jgi:hypothetical protein
MSLRLTDLERYIYKFFEDLSLHIELSSHSSAVYGQVAIASLGSDRAP